MQKILLLAYFLVFSIHADAKPILQVLNFLIGEKVVMVVHSLKEVKLSSEQNNGLQEIKTKPHPSKQNWDVEFTLNQEDAEQFAKLTENNIGKKLSISANGKTLISSKINASIAGGKANIVLPDEMEARRLFKTLKSIETSK